MMEKWINNQRDRYCSYKSYSYTMKSNVKTIFKNREVDVDNMTDLIEEQNSTQTRRRTGPTNRFGVSDRKRGARKVDDNGNVIRSRSFMESLDNQIWRRLSFKEYRKKRQDQRIERMEQKSKPMLPTFLRTYDRYKLDGQNSQWL